MALQLALTADNNNIGVPAPEAYARIATLNFDTRTGRVTVTVDIHYNLLARTNNKAPIKGGTYTGIQGVDMASIDENIVGVRHVLYTWLKTLPDFAGAVDV